MGYGLNSFIEDTFSWNKKASSEILLSGFVYNKQTCEKLVCVWSQKRQKQLLYLQPSSLARGRGSWASQHLDQIKLCALFKITASRFIQTVSLELCSTRSSIWKRVKRPWSEVIDLPLQANKWSFIWPLSYLFAINLPLPEKERACSVGGAENQGGTWDACFFVAAVVAAKMPKV